MESVETREFAVDPGLCREADRRGGGREGVGGEE